jgi:hypothetical protein
MNQYSLKENCLWLNALLHRLYVQYVESGRAERLVNKKLEQETLELREISNVGLLLVLS